MKAINKQRKNEFVEDDGSYGQKLKIIDAPTSLRLKTIQLKYKEVFHFFPKETWHGKSS